MQHFLLKMRDFPAGNRRKSLPRWLDFASQMIVVHQDWLKSLATARTKWANQKWGNNGSNMVKCCVGGLDVWIICPGTFIFVITFCYSSEFLDDIDELKRKPSTVFRSLPKKMMKWICKFEVHPFFPRSIEQFSSCQFGGPSPAMGFCQ